MATKIGYQAKSLFGKMYDKAGSTRTGHQHRAEKIGDFMQSQGLRCIEHMKLKHVERYMELQVTRGLSESTLANYASTLRAIAKKVGKGDMVAKSNAEAFGFSRDLGARRHPIMVDREKVSEVEKLLTEKGHEWAGLAYRMTQEFGLRRQEALLSNCIIVREGKTFLIVKGAKGGRAREIEVKNQSQRNVLEKVQGHIAAAGGNSLCPSSMNLKQAKQCYSNHVNRAGGKKVTNSHSHANRHGWAQLEKTAGASDCDLSKDLGHGRPEVVKHYVE